MSSIVVTTPAMSSGTACDEISKLYGLVMRLSKREVNTNKLYKRIEALRLYRWFLVDTTTYPSLKLGE